MIPGSTRLVAVSTAEGQTSLNLPSLIGGQMRPRPAVSQERPECRAAGVAQRGAAWPVIGGRSGAVDVHDLTECHNPYADVLESVCHGAQVATGQQRD